MNDNHNRAAIYIRVSTTMQADKDSLPMQRKDLTAYAELILNTTDYEIFEDAGYSGKNTDRPAFQRMMLKIRHKEFTHLLVWKLDRISRNLLDFASMYAELKKLGVVFISKNEQFDTSSAMGEAMLKIILVFAELERKMTSERVSATMRSRAREGLWNGGRVPYGYDYDKETKTFSINEEEARTVIRIHNDYLNYRSILVTATRLNADGLRTRYGKYWSQANINKILRSGFYTGDYLYYVHDWENNSLHDEDEWITVPDHHPAIVSKEMKNKVISIMEDNRRNGIIRDSAKIHVFRGKIICGKCGHRMAGAPASRKRDGWANSKYTCPYRQTRNGSICDNPSINDAIVGEYFINMVLNILNAQKRYASIHSPADLQEELLAGNAFRYIGSVEKEGLTDLYNIIRSGKLLDNFFDNTRKVSKPVSKKRISELTLVKARRTRLEKAVSRLTDLYIYSNKMSEAEYSEKRQDLESQLLEVNNRIEDLTASESVQDSISDTDFMVLASQFIIQQELSNREYINYRRLAMTTDPVVLKNFVESILESMTIIDGKLEKIIFRNGIYLTFKFKPGATKMVLTRNRKKQEKA